LVVIPSSKGIDKKFVSAVDFLHTQRR